MNQERENDDTCAIVWVMMKNTFLKTKWAHANLKQF